MKRGRSEWKRRFSIRRAIEALLSAIAMMLMAAILQATTLARMSVAEMTQAATLIVRARCVANSAGWDAGEIWTFSAFDVDEVWKGAPPEPITVRLLGGRAGNLTSSISGMPRFRPGEEVVLFLEPTARGDFSVVSWAQGTFRIGRNAAGAETATQDTAAFATFDPTTRQYEATGIRGVPIETLRARVADALGQGARRRP